MRLINSFAFKNAILYFFIFIIGIGSIGYLLLNYSSKRIINAAENQLSHNGELIEIQLVDFINGLISHIEYLNESPIIQDFLRDSSEPNFNTLSQSYLSLLNANPDISQIRFIEGKEGKELVRVERVKNTTSVISNDQLQIKKDRPYFREAIKLKKHEIYFSEINLNREFGTISIPYTPTLRIAKPIYIDDQVKGVIVINADLTKLFARLEKTVGDNYRLRMVNKQGYYLMHEVKDSTFLFEFDKLYPIQRNMSKENVGISHSLGQISSIHRLQMDVMDYEFIYFIIADKSTLLKGYYEWRNKSIYIVLAIGLLFTILSFTILKRQSNTLSHLTYNMKEFALRRKVLKLPTNRRDEIGDLAKGFKEMAEVIKNQINAIEAEKLKAENAEKEKSEFIENISHEIRNPLQSIMGLSKILEENKPNENQIDILNSIKLNTNNLHGLVNNILDYQNILKGNQVLHLAWLNLNNFLQEVITGNQYSGSLKEIDLTLEIDPTLNDLELEIDQLKVSQILNNLISNSKSSISQKGNITLKVKVEDLTKNPCILTYEVIDDGIGMNEGELLKIKERYFSNTKKNEAFTNFGLGLTIVNDLLTLMDSELKVKSEKGKGSTFYFQLHSRYRKVNKIYEIKGEKIFEGSKILFIDDDEQILDLYRHQFPNFNCSFYDHIDHTNDDNSTFDIIVCDYNLGSNTIVNYLEQLNKISHDNSYLLIVSGQKVDTKVLKDKFKNIDTLLKPFTKEDLKTNIYCGLTFSKYGTPNLYSIQKDYDFQKEKYNHAIDILIKEWRLYQERLMYCILNKNIEELESIIHKFNTTLKRLNLARLENLLYDLKDKMRNSDFNEEEEAANLELIMSVYLKKLEHVK